jgi:foldase protein PrsA
LKKQQLWLIIAALLLLNVFTFTFFLSKSKETSGNASENEVIANVGKNTISRQQWLDELVARYGKDVLKDMIDQQVIKNMAEKYKIQVSDQEVEREYRLLETTNYSPGNNKNRDEKKWKEQIHNTLLLEEILTKDVVLSDKDMQAYYQKNKAQFNIPTAYHLSQIIVPTKEEAVKAIKELEQGSNFSALAMERSTDQFSANEGGDIGYITENDERYPAEYIQSAKKLKSGDVSSPIKVDQGYAIVKLEGKITGKDYSYNEVKEQVRRQMALEQIKTPVSAGTFWKDANVDWVYGKKGTN